MIVIAIVRICRISGIDQVWQLFWQVLEPCVALVMTSITAFRSIFVTQETRERNRARWAAPAYSWIQRGKQKQASEAELDLWNTTQSEQQLPSIPHATVAKMKRFVPGKHHHGSRADGITMPDPEETRLSDEREREEEITLTTYNSKLPGQSIC